MTNFKLFAVLPFSWRGVLTFDLICDLSSDVAESKSRFALPHSWPNLTGSQLRLRTYPGLVLDRSQAAYISRFVSDLMK